MYTPKKYHMLLTIKGYPVYKIKGTTPQDTIEQQ